MNYVDCMRCWNHPVVTLALLLYFLSTISTVLKKFQSVDMLSVFSIANCYQAKSAKVLTVKSTSNITKTMRNYDNLQWILLTLPFSDLKIFSQQGEDGILLEIFDHIGHGRKEYVEFGVQNGNECNTRNLRVNHGWHGHKFDNENIYQTINLTKVDIWVDNILELFANFNISKRFDLLSIDTDFNDFWLTKTLFDAGYRPRVLVVKFNRIFLPNQSVTIPEILAKRHGVWDNNDFFGASILAFAKLMYTYGYLLVKIDTQAANSFFVDLSELNMIDFPLMHWVATLSWSTQVGIKGHVEDKRRRTYAHVCIGPVCDNSDDW